MLEVIGNVRLLKEKGSHLNSDVTCKGVMGESRGTVREAQKGELLEKSQDW